MSLRYEFLSRNQLVALIKERDIELQAQKLAGQKQQDRDAVLQQMRAEDPASVEPYMEKELQQQDAALQQKDLQLEAITQERDEYKLAYNELIKKRFRNQSERYIASPYLLNLDLGNTPESADAAAGLADAVAEAERVADVIVVPEHKRVKRKAKRDESLPAHLPRREVIADALDDIINCPIHGQRKLLPREMWGYIETLMFSRPELWVLRTYYRKYVCANSPECGLSSPPRPEGLVEGNKYDTSVASEILTGKYAYHMPLNRQQDYFAASGWTPSRSTQCNILQACYERLTDLLAHFKAKVLADHTIGCDDTTLTLLYPKVIPPLDPNNPRSARQIEVIADALEKKLPSITARMWAYRGVEVPLNVFDFTVSRHRDGPEDFFQEFRGTLLGDCWHGFEAISVASNERIVRAACVAHARRKIYESRSYPEDRAQWLRWFQELYRVEAEARTVSAAERLALRQAQSVPVWNLIDRWLEQVKNRTYQVILPTSDFGKALQYVRNHHAELKHYLSDGRVPIDNNETEQLMKQVAIGRKNWLFAGSIVGGERAAGFMTLVSSAVRNNLHVWQYVKDVLDRLFAGSKDYDSMLPWVWAQEHPDQIRQYRINEKATRARSYEQKSRPTDE